MVSDYRTLKAYLDTAATLDREELNPVGDIVIRLQCWILLKQNLSPGMPRRLRSVGVERSRTSIDRHSTYSANGSGRDSIASSTS